MDTKTIKLLSVLCEHVDAIVDIIKRLQCKENAVYHVLNYRFVWRQRYTYDYESAAQQMLSGAYACGDGDTAQEIKEVIAKHTKTQTITTVDYRKVCRDLRIHTLGKPRGKPYIKIYFKD